MSYLKTRPLTSRLSSALLLSAVLAGCGGSSSSSSSAGNGVADKSAAQIFEATKVAASQASSVHIVGSIVSSGKPIALNMELLEGKGGKGEISEEGFSIKLVQTGGAIYINGSQAFYRHVAGTAAAELLQGKWLKAPANSGELASLASLTDFGKLIGSALAHSGKLSKGSASKVEGQPAVALNDSNKGTLYVASTGKPYPLEIAKRGSESGKVLFNGWNKPVTLSVPAGAIDLDKLQKGH